MQELTESIELSQTKIISLNSQLQGIGDNTNLSFRYTNIGDEVSYEARGRGKNKYAKIHSVIRNKPYNPKCKHFGDCGGCSGQHLDYSTQIQIKTNPILNQFKKEYNLDLELIEADLKYQYRNRMDFAVFPNFIGLRQAENFRRIIDVSHCSLQSDWANEELEQLRGLIFEEYPNLAFNRKTGEGYLKYLTLRTSVDLTDTITIFTFTDEFQETELESKFAEDILKFSSSNNIIFCFNRKQSEVSAEGKFKILRGKSYYEETFFPKTIQVPFNSFFQPNPQGFMPIIRFIETKIDAIKRPTLIDLFCGNGFFGILFGEKFSKLVGYDWVESSIQTARENLNRIYPEKEILYKKKDLIQFKDVFSDSKLEDSVLILDPPRNGIGIKLCEFILNSSVQEIIYVSCNPYSQLEDLKILSQKFKILSGIITDPYPQTPHLESAIFLKRYE
ncbi:MAG TPA: hypothetical protein PK079_12265 [Leptospiraceae bacterium]|nr:hypothetical protein [Leptospiraceae bacterium]HMW06571.1 hypothetical protein [Leptospiraceae bacterium]HMX32139.1 hypothetical protein [Leptospiraceae bacterium]HMY31238.1 hypothetical protein [Leptospiraceae bacterium]HMZ63275.1 hypothetical protein [Leptospiraceae bacterium]